MKNMLYGVMLFALTMTQSSQSAVVNETNRVALAILSYASMDNEDDLEANEVSTVRYTDWNGLLDGVHLPGLTRQDKDSALYAYLLNQSTNNLSVVDGETKELIRVGLCECRDLNNTNVFPIVRNFLINPTAGYMDEPAYLYYKWAKVDEDYLRVTGQFLMNTSSVARVNKVSDWMFIESSVARHKKNVGSDTCYTNALKLLYHSRRFCPECAEVMDRMFVANIENYKMSVNRMQTLNHWIKTGRCEPEVLSYCESITNELIRVSGNLSFVEMLRGL